MAEIRVALVGVGNCASALVQGRYYYDDPEREIPGLITRNFAGYLPRDISFVTAFDIDERKVGRPLHEAVFAPPNCTTVFQPSLPRDCCLVEMGHVIDSLASTTLNHPGHPGYLPLRNRFMSEAEAALHVVELLRANRVEVMVNYLPVGSEKNSCFYADCAIEAGCAFVNAIPVFLSRSYADKFVAAGLPILGDDIKSQVGATIIHRMLVRLFEDRGHRILHTYQLNVGGNTDFLTMRDQKRLRDKQISKTESVTSEMHAIDVDNVHVGPSDFVPWLKDNKVCFLRIEAEQFGGVPMNLELRLSVEDSPNSAGVMMDAVRAAKVALDRGLCGPVEDATAWLFKSPVRQMEDSAARDLLRRFAEKQ